MSEAMGRSSRRAGAGCTTRFVALFLGVLLWGAGPAAAEQGRIAATIGFPKNEHHRYRCETGLCRHADDRRQQLYVLGGAGGKGRAANLRGYSKAENARLCQQTLAAGGLVFENSTGVDLFADTWDVNEGDFL